MVDVRIPQSFMFGPEVGKTVEGFLLNFLEGRERIDQLAACDDRNEELFPLKMTRICFADMGEHGVKRLDRLAIGKGFLLKDDHIAAHKILLVVKADHFFDARVGRFLRVIGNFQFRAQVPILEDRRQLLHPPEGRTGIGSHQTGAHPPHVDGGTLLFDRFNQPFVEVARSQDVGEWKSCFVEDPARFPA